MTDISRKTFLARATFGAAGATLGASGCATSAASTEPVDQRARNLEIIRAYYAAGARDDWATVGTFLTDDFVAHESPALPIAGEYRGVEGLQSLYHHLFGMVDFTHYDIYQMTAGGDWVVSLMTLYARGADGQDIAMPVAETIRLRDGKLCEMKPYWFDPSTLVRAAEARAARAG